MIANATAITPTMAAMSIGAELPPEDAPAAFLALGGGAGIEDWHVRSFCAKKRRKGEENEQNATAGRQAGNGRKWAEAVLFEAGALRRRRLPPT